MMNTSNAISSKVITFESKLEGSVFAALPFFLKQNINRKNENQSKLSLPLPQTNIEWNIGRDKK